MKLVAALAEDRERLWNINQKYLYEMTQYYPDVLDEKGVLHYGYFDAYFSDPKRKAFFLYAGDVLVGFAMLHPYSVIGHAPDYTMAEFTIFPRYRKKHYATEAVQLIFSEYCGKWEIKFNEKNAVAKAFWLKLTAAYNPQFYHLNEAETVLEFIN